MYTLKKNILESNFSDELESIMIKESIFPWYYNDFIVKKNEKNNSLFQFTHVFYNNDSFVSSFYLLILPILDILKPKEIIRIKANLTTKTDNPEATGYHTDVNFKNSKTAIYYVNSNNGSTAFKNNVEIPSIKNDIVIFNSFVSHTGKTCTDEKVRCLINFNYF